ncbi:hypothetical protein ACT17S_00635 [Glutamicibacter mysorens]
MPEFKDAYRKLSWSTHLIGETRKTYEEWRETNLFITNLTNPSHSEQRWLLRFHTAPPENLVFRIGDILSNLASTLDYVAWDLYLANGGSAQDKLSSRIYYPISSSAERFPVRTEVQFGSEAAEIMRNCQDFSQEEQPHNALEILKLLCNSQKHRALHLMTLNQDFNFEFTVPHIPDGLMLCADIMSHDKMEEIVPGKTLTLGHYWVYDTNDPERRPVSREDRFSMPSIPAPERSLAITDGRNYMPISAISDLARRVENVLDAMAKGLG